MLKAQHMDMTALVSIHMLTLNLESYDKMSGSFPPPSPMAIVM